MKTKKYLFGLLIILSATAIYASESVITPVSENFKEYMRNIRIQPVVLVTNQVKWRAVDTTTMAGNEPNNLTAAAGAKGYGGRTYLGVINDANTGAAEVSVLVVPPTWNGIKFRCIGVTDNNAVTYQVYAGSIPDVNTDGAIPSGSNCALVHIGQLAWTIGGQVSDIAGYKFADQLTITTANMSTGTAVWITSTGGVTGPANDYVAQCKVDLENENILVFVPTFVNCDCMLLATGF